MSPPKPPAYRPLRAVGRAAMDFAAAGRLSGDSAPRHAPSDDQLALAYSTLLKKRDQQLAESARWCTSLQEQLARERADSQAELHQLVKNARLFRRADELGVEVERVRGEKRELQVKVARRARYLSYRVQRASPCPARAPRPPPAPPPPPCRLARSARLLGRASPPPSPGAYRGAESSARKQVGGPGGGGASRSRCGCGGSRAYKLRGGLRGQCLARGRARVVRGARRRRDRAAPSAVEPLA